MTPNKTTVQWIWLPELRNLPCTFAFFRREIVIEDGLQKAGGFITADSRYELYLNGNRIQKGPAPYDPRYHEYDPFNLTDQLQPGVNTIGVLVCFFGHGDGTYIPGNPGFWFSLTLEYNDHCQTIISDSDWKVLRAECWQAGHYKRWFLRAIQEEFDARLYPYGWNQNGYDDQEWFSAMVQDVDPGKPVVCRIQANSISGFYIRREHEMGYHLEQREIPPLNYEKIICNKPAEAFSIHWQRSPENFFDHYELDAYRKDNGSPFLVDEAAISVILTDKTSAVLVYELPEEMVGYPFIQVKAPAGTVIELMFADSRDKLMFAERRTETLSYYMIGNWARVTAKDGITRFETFDYEGLRFLCVAIRGKPGDFVQVLEAGVIRRLYPYAKKPDFNCSDPVINRVHAGGVNTCLNTCLETIVDNNSRERQQYSGEMGHAKLSLYLGFGEYRLPRRVIRTFARGQSQEGWFFDCFPAWDRLERLWQKAIQIATSPSTGMIIDCGLQFIFDIYKYILYSGDAAILSEVYDRVRKHGAWLESIETSEGFIPVEGLDHHSTFLDHQGFSQQKHKSAAMNIYYYGYLAEASVFLANIMGDSDYSDHCLEKAARLKEQLFNIWWDRDSGLFVDNLQWLDQEKTPRYHDRTLSMALLYDLVPVANREKFLQMLADCPDNMGLGHPCNGGWRLWALSKYGWGGEVIKDLRNRWGTLRQLLENNTLPESWNTNGAWCQSPAAPIFILYGEVLGIRPLETGYKKTLIYPQSGDLAFMEGSVGTPLGVIALKAAVQNSGEYSLEVSLPGSMTAIIVPPREYPLWDVRCIEGSIQTQPAAHLDFQALEIQTSGSFLTRLILTCRRV